LVFLPPRFRRPKCSAHSVMPCASAVTSRGKISPSLIVGRKERWSRFRTSLPSSFAVNADIIVAWTTPAALAAKAVTATIPIVTAGIGDPVDAGVLRSLRRVGIVRNPSNPAVTSALLVVKNAIRILIPEGGDVAGENVAIEYRWAEPARGRVDRTKGCATRMDLNFRPCPSATAKPVCSKEVVRGDQRRLSEDRNYRRLQPG
jgi:hypothetical protein